MNYDLQDQPGEVWAETFFSPNYLISNHGRLKALYKMVGGKSGSLRPVPERILKVELDSYGYYRINLTVNSKQLKYRIHRLVAIAFIPNPKNLPQINHIDGNKTNNLPENLEWCTLLENMAHAWRTGIYTNARKTQFKKGHTGHPNLLKRYKKDQAI